MNKKIYLAGGCFWGMQALFRELPGVLNTTAGTAGGDAETLEIEYDTDKISYKELLDFFFRIHNPATLNQQGNDIGTAYRSAIFYADEEEKQIAEDFRKLVDKSGKWEDPVVTTLEPFKKFETAEEAHQDYLQKNPEGYTCHAIHVGSYL